MSEIERIDDQLRRAFESEAWHGPSVREVLEGVTAEKAAARPLPSAHSIWEIVVHVTATQGLVIGRLGGDDTPLTPEQDWPEVSDTGEESWRAAREALEDSYRELRRALRERDDSELDHPVLPGHSSLYENLHGIIQHDLYHAGQIALLKKG
jgi:uncharacterized damage-inducible protein DinB